MHTFDDLIGQALSVLRGMWHWRWTGLIVAWLVGAVSAVVIYRLPDQYEASSRIYVDTQSVLKPLMAGLAVQPNIDQQIHILSRTLISRPNMEKLVRLSDLDLAATSPEERERLVDMLLTKVRIMGAGGVNLYTLAYRDSQPQTAQRVVQALTSMFVESSLGDKRKDTDSARVFINEQIKVYEKKLTEAENRLKEFKLRNLNLNMGSGGDSFARLGDASSALSQARLQLAEAINSRDVLRRQIEGEEPVLMGVTPDTATAAPPISVPEIDNRIQALKQNLDSLLQRYTDEHPDVSGTRRVIRDLEEQKRQELAARKALQDQKRQELAARKGTTSSQPVNTGANNPVYQQLKIAFAEAEANVASLQTRVAAYEARYNQSRASMNRVPEIEAEFTRLDRDYSIHKQNYEALVGRRESAAMSGQMEATSAMAEFRLIDPPRVTPKAVEPNRLRLFSLALLGALAAGMLSSLAASLIRPSFLDAHSLHNVTGVPVLGTVSLIVSEPLKRRERRGLIGFIAAAIALLGSYGAGIAVLSLMSLRGV